MKIKKSAQQKFFKLLQPDERFIYYVFEDYNRYPLKEWVAFTKDLEHLHNKFITELNNNLLSRLPILPIYLNDILLTLERFKKEARELFDDFVKGRDVYEKNHDKKSFADYQHILGFLDSQLQFSQKATIEVQQKIQTVSNPKIFKPTEDSFAEEKTIGKKAKKTKKPTPAKKLVFKTDIKDVIAFFWLLVKADKIESIEAHVLAKFVNEKFDFTTPQELPVEFNSAKKNMKSPDKLIFKMDLVKIVCLFWFMMKMNVFETISKKDFKKIIVINFKYMKADKIYDITDTTIMSAFSKTRFTRAAQKNFKKEKLPFIRSVWNDINDKVETDKDKAIINSKDFILSRLEECELEPLPSEE